METISAIGQFQAELRRQYFSCSATVCVVPGREKPILSWMTSQKLKLITLVHSVSDQSNDPKPEDTTFEFSDLFQGLGKSNGRQDKTVKNVYALRACAG